MQDTGEIVSMVVGVFAALLLLIFWYQSWKYKLKGWKSRTVWWTLGILCSAGSFGFFGAPNKYWLFHSLWHVLGALAGAAFIMGGFDQTEPVKLPKEAWTYAWDVPRHQSKLT